MILIINITGNPTVNITTILTVNLIVKPTANLSLMTKTLTHFSQSKPTLFLPDYHNWTDNWHLVTKIHERSCQVTVTEAKWWNSTLEVLTVELVSLLEYEAKQ